MVEGGDARWGITHERRQSFERDSRDGELGGARRKYARPGSGRSWRRKKWNEQEARGQRRRGKGHIDRRRRDWAARCGWKKIGALAALRLVVVNCATELKGMAEAKGSLVNSKEVQEDKQQRKEMKSVGVQTEQDRQQLVIQEVNAASTQTTCEDGGARVQWEGEAKILERVEKLKEQWAEGESLVGSSLQRGSGEMEERADEELRMTGNSRRNRVTRKPVEAVELAIQGVGTVLWEAGGRWIEGSSKGQEHIDRFGELWKVSAAGGAEGTEVRLEPGGRTEARVKWVRSKMVHITKKDFEEVVKMWRLREVVRVEVFLRLVVLGGGQWSATRSWTMHEGAGSAMMERLLRIRDRVRKGNSDVCVAGLAVAQVRTMIQAADRGEVGEVLTEGLNRRLKRDAVKLFESGDKWSETRAGRRSMQKQLRGAEWGLRWEVAVQTEETVQSEHHDAGHIVQVVRLQQEVQELKKRSEMLEMMLRDSNGRIDELDTKGRGEKRDRATQAGLWEKKAAEQAGEGGNGEKQEHADADNGPAKSGGVPGDTGGLGVSSSAETGTGTGGVPGDSGVRLRAVVAEEDEVASSVPSWAEVASDGEQKAQQDAVWELKFAGRVVKMGTAAVVHAIRGAIMGLSNFEETVIGEGLLQYNYDEPWPKHFVHRGKGNTVTGKAGQRRAWLRRELRGLVLRDTGEVVARGLHKFFNVGQMDEVQVQRLHGKQIDEVTDKLDGQMVMGVVVGEEVRMWSRKGAIRDTAVGKAAGRVAGAGHKAMVRHVVETGCTPVFEMVGALSRIKADEGREPRLVLVAVRRHCDGGYWGHGEMAQMAHRFQVEVVVRHVGLEGLQLNDLVDQVKGWRMREGVVIRFSDGTMVKVKSRWWASCGFTYEVRSEAVRWKQEEQRRQEKFKRRAETREQRMAITGVRGRFIARDLFHMLQGVLVVEVVYNDRGRITVVMVGFEHAQDRCRAEQVINDTGWRVEKAYSRRTRGGPGRRVEVFKVSRKGA